MMRSLPELQKPVWHFGSLGANGIKLDNKAVVPQTFLYACGTCTVYQRLANRLNKNVENQMATQDTRHRDTEEGRDAKHAYCLKASTAEMDGQCYKNPKKIFYGELQEGKRSQEKTKHRHPQRTSSYQQKSWEQAAQDRSKNGAVSLTKQQPIIRKENLWS